VRRFAQSPEELCAVLISGSFRMEVSARLGENTLAAGPHTIANINIEPTTSSKEQACALQLAALQLLKKGLHLWLTT
jgi:hypothetical protein